MSRVEIAVAMFNSDNPLGVRVGDVVVSRTPLHLIGRRERRLFVWMEFDGFDDDEIETLGKSEYSDKDELIQLRKSRFTVPFAEIRKEDSLFDTMRALNKTETYQPFMTLNTQTGAIIPVKSPEKPKLSFIDKTTDKPFELRET